MPRSVLLRGPQRLAKVGGEVVGILEAYREADHVLADAGRLKLLRGHLLVRGAGRMDNQRLGVADVGEMRGEAAGLDEFRPCLATALHAEGNDGATAPGPQLPAERVRSAERGVGNECGSKC